MKNIYLAGPDVFYPNAKQWFESKKQICAKYGCVGHAPLDNNLDPNDFPTRFAFGMAIYMSDKQMMDDCDIAVANMTPYHGVSMDVGTAFEMGYMAAQGKPVYGYSNDPTAFIDRQKTAYAHYQQDGETRTQHTHMLFEDMDMCDNLMMVGAVFDSTGTPPTIAHHTGDSPVYSPVDKSVDNSVYRSVDIYTGTDAFERTMQKIATRYGLCQ